MYLMALLIVLTTSRSEARAGLLPAVTFVLGVGDGVVVRPSPSRARMYMLVLLSHGNLIQHLVQSGIFTLLDEPFSGLAEPAACAG